LVRWSGLEYSEWLAAMRRAEAAHCDLLRDVIGNPFRTPVATAASSTWADAGNISQLAQAIYDDRAFDWLPKLGHALEGAGCTDADLLGHFRGPGPHVRGCWALDLILSRK
jgi:hypothetical protein